MKSTYSLRAGLIGVFLCSIFGATSAYSNIDPGGQGGGSMPDPLTVFNEHVELADGEMYLLVGEIVMAPVNSGRSHELQAFFRPDFDVQPWLASRMRKASPLYAIEGSSTRWKRYEGKRVKLAVHAHSSFSRVTLEAIPELSSAPGLD